MPLLFVAFINGKAFYIHSHYIDDLIVIHSHPYKKGESAPHEHTAKELASIKFYTEGQSTANIIPDISIENPFSFRVAETEAISYNVYLSCKCNAKLLRAPPIFII